MVDVPSVEVIRETIEDSPNKRIMLAADDDLNGMHPVVDFCNMVKNNDLFGVKFSRQLVARHGHQMLLRIAADHDANYRFLDAMYKIPVDQVQRQAPSTESKHAPHIDFLSIDLNGGPTFVEKMLEIHSSTMLVGASVDPSLSPHDIESVYGDPDIDQAVLRHARWAGRIGLCAFACTTRQAELIRKESDPSVSSMLLFVSGIRMPQDESYGRHYITTAHDALNAGADVLIVGRSITKADDPPAKIEEIIQTIS